MTNVRWGLLSTANINRRIIPAIRLSGRGELVGVASRSLETAVSYAEKWDIPQSFGSYDALLASSDIDAVYISLPNHLHADWSISAMRQGKHVLCEKPLALTVEEVDAITAVSEETGRVTAEAFMYQHHPQAEAIRAFVDSGRLGAINRIYSTFSFRMRSRDNVRLVPEFGGGSLWDVGVYPVSISQMVMGESPEWVFGEQQLGAEGVDEVFTGQMRYKNGVVAQISCGFRSPVHTALEIFGANGRLLATRPFTGVNDPEQQLTFFPAEGEPEEIPVAEAYLYLGEVEDIHDVVLDGKRPFLPLATSRDHIRTVLALYQSAQTGQPVQLAENTNATEK